MLSEWMAIEDAADYLEISIQQLDELISQKRVQSRTNENRIEVSGNDVERLWERGQMVRHMLVLTPDRDSKENNSSVSY